MDAASPQPKPWRPPDNWRFIAAFAAIYCVLYVGYSAIPDAFLRDVVYYEAIVRPSRLMIGWIAPGEHVIGIQNRLQSATAALNVVRGCDGAGIVFLLIAAILAFRAELRRTLLGLAGAIALVYALNQLRIVALYFVNSYRPAWFVALHVYFIPTLMILAGALYFAVWAMHDSVDREPSAAT
jgi:exosortase family protein XrtM